MIKPLIFLAIVFFAAVISLTSASAQSNRMYSYTDENGTVVFTDKKPEDRNVAPQAIPQGPPPQGGNPYAQAAVEAQPSAGQARREEIVQGRQQARDAKAELEAQCAEWQAEVDRLEPHRRVFYTDENGETVRMDDVERVNRVAELKRQIAADCR
jgi:hypothetical protein